MADKRKQLNSVEEQRARQKELIELKRQKEAFNENPKEYRPEASGEDVVQQSAKSRISNFWYYSKYTIGFILIVAVILTVGLTQCATKTDYDMTIVMYFKTYANSTMSENLAIVAEQYCEDYNGDGKVEVLVINCSIPDDQRLTDTDGATRLLGQFQNEEAIVYIVDTGAYEDLSGSFGDDFLDNSLSLPDYNGTAYKLNGTVFDAAFDTVSEGYTDTFDYYLMRRNVSGTAIESKGDVRKHSSHANDFIEAVVADPYMNDGVSSDASAPDNVSSAPEVE